VKRTPVLDAGVRSDNLDTWFAASHRPNARPHGTELRIVDGIKKVSSARKQLRPRVPLVNLLRRSPGWRNPPQLRWPHASRRPEPKGIAEEKYGPVDSDTTWLRTSLHQYGAAYL
jgi:hypothetical protein